MNSHVSVRPRQSYARELLRNTIKYRMLVYLMIPGILLTVFFCYVPMVGQIVAFKKFNYTQGLFGSPWVGFENFKFLFTNSKTFGRIVRNTVGYYFLFTTVGTIGNVSLAIMLHECMFRRFAKISHTVMIMPTFISFVAVTYIVEAVLSLNGLANNIVTSLGGKKTMFYMKPAYWPFILQIINIWKGTGFGCILYLSALSGMDPEVFEAAELDGARKMQQIRYITLPMLTSMVSILLLMGLGGIMSSSTGLHYQVTKNTGVLYSTTQTIDAYVTNAIMSGGGGTDYGQTGAVSFFQSFVGSFMVITVNLIVRRIEPDNALF